MTVKLNAQIETVASSIRSAGSSRRTRSTLAAVLATLPFLASAFLAGGYYESTYSLLAAALWLSLAAAAALTGLRRPSPALGFLAAFAVWTTVSALWGEPGAALRSVPLAALYVGVLALGELVGGETLLRALWASLSLVVVVALAGRLTDLAPAPAGPASERLAWPVTYANGLGLVAVSALVLAAGLPGARPRLVAASAALSGAAVYLTFSRSALLAGLAAALLLLVLRPASARGLAAAVVGVGAVAALDALTLTSGPRLLPALGVGMAVAALLPPFRLHVPRAAAVATALALALATVLLAKPIAARFAAPAPDERAARRLLDVSGHGRAELWRVAWEQGTARPLTGGGAGTWPRAYIEETGSLGGPANAHSLYLETFAELGAIGVLLLLAAVVVVFRAGLRDGSTWRPAALAAFAAWAVHAGVDWLWQLPAATIPALLAAGSLLAGAREPLERETGTGGRALAASVAALAVGLGAGLHGIGAALLESGVWSPERARLTARLLPFDARPYAALAASERERGRPLRARLALARACAIDEGEPVLRREPPSVKGCSKPR